MHPSGASGILHTALAPATFSPHADVPAPGIRAPRIPALNRLSVPARSVVIPGTRAQKFPAGEYQLPCALIIGKRNASTDSKTSLNAVLRDFSVPV